MTQPQLVIEYIKDRGSILPAKLGGVVYLGTMFGSETTKRCRELRKKGVLFSQKEGKFERFFANRSHRIFNTETVVPELMKIEKPSQPTLMPLPMVANPGRWTR